MSAAVWHALGDLVFAALLVVAAFGVFVAARIVTRKPR